MKLVAVIGRSAARLVRQDQKKPAPSPNRHWPPRPEGGIAGRWNVIPVL
jgi:hypothetical protein